MIIKIIGALLIATPFICFFSYVIYQGGWREFFTLIGLISTIVGFITAGTILFYYDKKSE